MMSWLRTIDTQIFYWINHGLNHSWMDYVMAILTELGSGRFGLGVGLLCLCFRKKEIRLMGALVLAASYVSIETAGILKQIFKIPRPFFVLDDVKRFLMHRSYGFPSGHTMHAFTLASVLTLCCRPKYLMYVLAGVVAFSRVYLGVHWPSDVVAGAAFGLAIGYIFIYIYRRSTAESKTEG